MDKIKLLNTNTISQADVINTLKNYVKDNDDMLAELRIDAVYDFASELTGLSTDALAECVNE